MVLIFIYKLYGCTKMTIKQIDGYKIRMDKCLGQGAYGSVYIGESDKTHKNVAIKVIQKNAIDSDDYLKSALFQQIKIMQSVHNPNIVQFVDVMESSKNYYIIQELCDGDITKIMTPKTQLKQDDCINMLTQICNGFLALVREGIIHRDLKPANIMIKDKILKIGDFGFAKKIPNKNFKINSVVGTPLYMSLQILKNQQYTSKCDIWALGFIFYEMLHGHTPWTAKNQYQLIQNISSMPLKIGRNDLKPATIDFIKKCLETSEEKRISWDDLFLHPIFNGFFDNKGTNKGFENKLKQIMGDLRFYIKSNNLDLTKILYSLGYTSQNQQLDFEAYYTFLRNVNPDIRKEQALYVFKQTDVDHSNSISILEIQKILQKYDISFTSSFKGVPKFAKKQKEESQTFELVSEKVQQRIHNCFARLYKIITKNKMTLQKVFNDFDKAKDGNLSEGEFKKMMQKLDKNMPEEEIIEAFNLIDEDGSKTIEYDELNKYYCKVNGIPYKSGPVNEPMDIQPSYISNSNHSIGSQNSQNSSFKLQHQNSFPPQQQFYGQPPMYPPNMYYGQPMYPPPQMYPPPPPAQQPQGMFGNFIMNQISKHMYEKSGSDKSLPNNNSPWS